ncbi:hypothetical protein IAE39_000949 [Pseudomonas sp. S37]|uniref:hypothetical protein n=1 Tax=Pseudomonas sp. S37 TaxID=2767449 RepID=UPI001911FE8B|nr:hypothetical protein [Pseudomonas sp. S37]MBK4992775.1 hypothetical protein [Pseudomonas sp. S37]
MHHSEVAYLDFNREQGQAIALASQTLTELGGPEARGVAVQARLFAEQLETLLSADQQSTLQRFSAGQLSALMFRQMPGADDPPPEKLADIMSLANSNRCQFLASRNHLLLALAQHRSFAFDIDNDGKQVRLVANFKGGGCIPLLDEKPDTETELTSHAGMRLGPHTEAPYNCSTVASNGHSPAPCALILTARWNPAHEATAVFPLRHILERMHSLDVLALTSPSFDFTRSECFADGHGNAGQAVSLLQFNPDGGFAIRYNSYRFSLNANASRAAVRAFNAFQQVLSSTPPLLFDLQADTALLINNGRALHSRDIIRDNRRLLLRQFGYSRCAVPIVIAEDPLLVRA